MAEVISSPVLSGEDQAALDKVMSRIEKHRRHNLIRTEYYEAHRRVKDFKIATPPELRNTGTVIGWPGTVIDALDERLDIMGFTAPGLDVGDVGVQEIWDSNELYREYSGAHVDAFIQGVAFLAVSRGGEGEPDPLITVESPLSMSAVYDPRGRRIQVAAAITRDDDNRPVAASLYHPHKTTHVERNATGKWVITHRDHHKLGRVTVRRLVNNPRASRQWGRSEITPDIMHFTQAAMRTLVGAEISREFYSAPQRWLIGATEETFQDKDGRNKTPWESYIGRYLALSRNEDDPDAKDPRVGQFEPSSPTPYIELVKMFSLMVASAAAIPPTYFGFVTENPPSADAIRAFEARHVKRAARRCTNFGPEWAGAIKDAILLRDGTIPKELHGLRTKWADTGTPTPAAAADATTKLVAAFPWMQNSDVALERLGFDQTDLDRLRRDRSLAGTGQIANMLSHQAPDDDELAAAAGRGEAAITGRNTFATSESLEQGAGAGSDAW